MSSLPPDLPRESLVLLISPELNPLYQPPRFPEVLQRITDDPTRCGFPVGTTVETRVLVADTLGVYNHLDSPEIIAQALPLLAEMCLLKAQIVQEEAALRKILDVEPLKPLADSLLQDLKDSIKYEVFYNHILQKMNVLAKRSLEIDMQRVLGLYLRIASSQQAVLGCLGMSLSVNRDQMLSMTSVPLALATSAIEQYQKDLLAQYEELKDKIIVSLAACSDAAGLFRKALQLAVDSKVKLNDTLASPVTLAFLLSALEPADSNFEETLRTQMTAWYSSCYEYQKLHDALVRVIEKFAMDERVVKKAKTIGKCWIDSTADMREKCLIPNTGGAPTAVFSNSNIITWSELEEQISPDLLDYYEAVKPLFLDRKVGHDLERTVNNHVDNSVNQKKYYSTLFKTAATQNAIPLGDEVASEFARLFLEMTGRCYCQREYGVLRLLKSERMLYAGSASPILKHAWGERLWYSCALPRRATPVSSPASISALGTGLSVPPAILLAPPLVSGGSSITTEASDISPLTLSVESATSPDKGSRPRSAPPYCYKPPAPYPLGDELNPEAAVRAAAIGGTTFQLLRKLPSRYSLSDPGTPVKATFKLPVPSDTGDEHEQKENSKYPKWQLQTFLPFRRTTPASPGKGAVNPQRRAFQPVFAPPHLGEQQTPAALPGNVTFPAKSLP